MKQIFWFLKFINGGIQQLCGANFTQFSPPLEWKIVVILHNIYPFFTKPRLDWFPNPHPHPPPHSCPHSYWMTPMDLAYFAFAVHLVHCLRMVFLNLDEKGERCRDCIETLPWLEALLLRFGGHRRKCPMTNIVSDKVRLSSTSRGTRQLMVYPRLRKAFACLSCWLYWQILYS